MIVEFGLEYTWVSIKVTFGVHLGEGMETKMICLVCILIKESNFLRYSIVVQQIPSNK